MTRYYGEYQQSPSATPEGGEKIRVLNFTFDEFLELGTNPKMRDLVIRIILLEAQIDKKKREIQAVLSPSSTRRTD